MQIAACWLFSLFENPRVMTYLKHEEVKLVHIVHCENETEYRIHNQVLLQQTTWYLPFTIGIVINGDVSNYYLYVKVSMITICLYSLSLPVLTKPIMYLECKTITQLKPLELKTKKKIAS